MFEIIDRTSSIQTFDSLDFARYSDDGGGQVDERVAGTLDYIKNFKNEKYILLNKHQLETCVG